jgi:ABC-type transporter Mla maintaining outer membrane lipid asymmetry ATPase subunit MlaF
LFKIRRILSKDKKFGWRENMGEDTFHPAVIEMRGVQVAALRDSSLAVLDDVNWSVLPGEFWVLAGLQHSGKSDLLMHAAGLLTPAGGSCRVFGCETAAFGEAQLADRLRVGFVFADGKLFNQLTLAENVALPLRYQKNLTAAEAARAVEMILELLELAPFADFTPAHLSANWRRRAALARALILQPELLLLDNPLDGLDARHRQWLLQFLEQLWRGHDSFGGRPMTLVATTGDLRAWQHPQRKFAVVADKTFSALGNWPEVEASGDRVVKELLAGPVATTI